MAGFERNGKFSFMTTCLWSHSAIYQLCDLGWFPSSLQSSVSSCVKSERTIHRVVPTSWRKYILKQFSKCKPWLVVSPISDESFQFQFRMHGILHPQTQLRIPSLGDELLPVQESLKNTFAPGNWKESIAYFPTSDIHLISDTWPWFFKHNIWNLI